MAGRETREVEMQVAIIGSGNVGKALAGRLSAPATG
jgi:predicted dinucleotide-binding enzyme